MNSKLEVSDWKPPCQLLPQLRLKLLYFSIIVALVWLFYWHYSLQLSQFFKASPTLVGRSHAKSQPLFLPHMARVAYHTYNSILT